MKYPLIAATALAGAVPAFAQTLPVAPQTGIAAPVAAPVATPTPPSTISPPATVTPPPIVHRRNVPPSPAELRVRAANRAATQEPASGGFVNAVQVYPFGEGTIYHVLTAPGQVTDIALQPGEALVSVAAGDTVRWVIGDTTSGSGDTKRTHILAKPFAAGLSTNVLVTTDRRSYHLTLSSTAHTAMAALSWTYPQDALIALQREREQAQAAAPVSTGLALDQLHFGYVVSGDEPAWRPLRAFDDGRQTFIEFPESIAVGEAPPLFLVDAKGTASLVNYRVQSRFYVVDRLFDVAELRLGLKKQQIVRIARTGDNGRQRRGS